MPEAAETNATAAAAPIATPSDTVDTYSDVPDALPWSPPPMWSQSWPQRTVAAVTTRSEAFDDENDEATDDEQEYELDISIDDDDDDDPLEASPPAIATVDVSAELIRVLDVVTTMCDHVIEYIEADRAERRMMIEALTSLAKSIERAAPPAAALNGNGSGNGYASNASRGRGNRSAEHVIGGSMPAGAEPDIDLNDAETAVEVRCRFGDRWVEGFEICEVLRDAENVRYRLRRRVDGVVLPAPFDAADIRHVETFEELTAPQVPPRRWSPL